MFSFILGNFKELDLRAKKILRCGLFFCFMLIFLSCYILFLYSTYFVLDAYFFGISLFKLGLVFGIEFLVCSLVVDSIFKNKI